MFIDQNAIYHWNNAAASHTPNKSKWYFAVCWSDFCIEFNKNVTKECVAPTYNPTYGRKSIIYTAFSNAEMDLIKKCVFESIRQIILLAWNALRHQLSHTNHFRFA